MTVIFSINELLDEQSCYEFLVNLLHPEGLHCPSGHSLKDCKVHKRNRSPLLRYVCRNCGRSFNAFTGTILQGTHLKSSQIVQLLRGIVKGEPTSVLAEELEVDRKSLLSWRHRLQNLAAKSLPREPLPDKNVEADEMFQNAGEKGEKHENP